MSTSIWLFHQFGKFWLQVEGARCIGEQQWRPWFRRSKLYSLMAATRRPDPGVAIKNFWPLEPRTLLRPNSTFFSSLVSY